MSIRVLIADDHAVVRRGILTLLEDEADIEAVGEAVDGEEALTMIPTVMPNVLLLDITMPRLSGLDVTKRVVALFPSVRILIFSMHNNPDYILGAVQNGASGYLPKDSDRDEILRAVRVVARGEMYYPPSATTLIINYLLATQSPKKAILLPTTTGSGASVWKKITSREAQILTCLTEGLSSRDIARRFGVSPHTVANQRASIIRKAGVANTAELISLALRDSK